VIILALASRLVSFEKSSNNNNNKIPYYLRAQPTAARPITDRHSVNTSNYIVDKHNIKSKTNYKQALEEKHINA
jgi:hypothetical protein